MAPKAKQNKSDRKSVKKSPKRARNTKRKANLMLWNTNFEQKIAKLEGGNVLLHDKNLDVTKELVDSKNNLEETQVSLIKAKETVLQLTLQKQVPIVQGKIGVLPEPITNGTDKETQGDSVAGDADDSSDSNDENSSSSDEAKGWEENFFNKIILEELQQEVDFELAARKKALKCLRKQNKPLEYKLQYTPAEYVSKIMKLKWSNEFLVKHKMTNEPSKWGASTKLPMNKREKNLLLSTIKKALSRLPGYG